MPSQLVHLVHFTGTDVYALRLNLEGTKPSTADIWTSRWPRQSCQCINRQMPCKMTPALSCTLDDSCDNEWQAAATHSCRDQPLMRDPTMGYLKLNLASQSLRLSISILPRPCKHCQLSSPPHRHNARSLLAKMQHICCDASPECSAMLRVPLDVDLRLWQGSTAHSGTQSTCSHQRREQDTSRLSLQSAVSVEINANALAHSCPAKGYMPSGP